MYEVFYQSHEVVYPALEVTVFILTYGLCAKLFPHLKAVFLWHFIIIAIKHINKRFKIISDKNYNSIIFRNSIIIK